MQVFQVIPLYISESHIGISKQVSWHTSCFQSYVSASGIYSLLSFIPFSLSIGSLNLGGTTFSSSFCRAVVARTIGESQQSLGASYQFVLQTDGCGAVVSNQSIDGHAPVVGCGYLGMCTAGDGRTVLEKVLVYVQRACFGASYCHAVKCYYEISSVYHSIYRIIVCFRFTIAAFQNRLVCIRLSASHVIRITEDKPFRR